MGNIAEHPYEIQHIPPARHYDPDVVVLGHWILPAAIVGSSMAFINGTVANVALPSIQSDLGATRTVDRAVDYVFLSAFRVAMFISAGMAVTSAIAAALLIQGRVKKGNEPGRSGPHAGG